MYSEWLTANISLKDLKVVFVYLTRMDFDYLFILLVCSCQSMPGKHWQLSICPGLGSLGPSAVSESLCAHGFCVVNAGLHACGASWKQAVCKQRAFCAFCALCIASLLHPKGDKNMIRGGKMHNHPVPETRCISLFCVHQGGSTVVLGFHSASQQSPVAVCCTTWPSNLSDCSPTLLWPYGSHECHRFPLSLIAVF